MAKVKIPPLKGLEELRISGRVAPTETRSSILVDKMTGKKFKDIMSAGVFIRGIKNNGLGDIYANSNHGRNNKDDVVHPGDKVLGREADSTLSLYEDANGLYSRLKIKKDKFHLIEDATFFQGWSFEFDILDFEKRVDDDGIEIHYIKDIKLWGVTLLDDRNIAGAYANGTTVHVRDASGDDRRICCHGISSDDIVIEDSPVSIDALKQNCLKKWWDFQVKNY